MSNDKSSEDSADEKLDTAFQQLESRQSSDNKQTTGKSGSGAGGVIAVFLSLIAIGIASWPAYELYRSRATAGEFEAKLLAQIESLSRRQQSQQATIDDLNAAVTAARAAASDATAFDQLRVQVEEDLAALEAQLGTSSQDWLFAEVEYLVRMANQRVLMERDSTSALQLLSAADAIVRDAEGLTAHGLRQALAGDIAALKAVNTVDVQGIYLELSALISQAPKLARTLPVYEPPPSESVTDLTDASLLQRVISFAKAGLSRLASLVDFRRGVVEVTPILPPDEEYYLRQNLIMKLQLAQRALLEGNQLVYATALAEAGSWTAVGFDSDDAATQAMVNSIARLAVIEITSELPDISASLRATRATLADFHEAENK